MTFIIAKSVLREMVEAAYEVAPFEACGLLAGTASRATKCYVLTNADASAEHFSMLPEEQFTAVKDMRRNGLQMTAIWHSHPASPARMSEEDMRLAYTSDVLYVIVSLAEPGVPHTCAFEVRDGVERETPVAVEEKEGQPS